MRVKCDVRYTQGDGENDHRRRRWRISVRQTVLQGTASEQTRYQRHQIIIPKHDNDFYQTGSEVRDSFQIAD